MIPQITLQQAQELEKQGQGKALMKAIKNKELQVVEEFDDDEKGIQNEFERMDEENQNSTFSSPSSTFQYNPTDNLIKWQLDLNDILERAEHILREDIVVLEKGNMIWKLNPNEEKRIFNDYAVQEIMRILSMYINRNTILSDYEPDEISDKVFDIGKEINDLIFMKYESFGLDCVEKRKNYPMLVREMIDIVHSAYKRAQYGGERESLRTARNISQTEQIMPPNFNMQTGEGQKERGMLNPLRYAISKYK